MSARAVTAALGIFLAVVSCDATKPSNARSTRPSSSPTNTTSASPAASARTSTIDIGEPTRGIVVAYGAVWVGTEGGVARIDPASDRVVAKIPFARVDAPLYGGAGELAVGAGAIWALNGVGTDDDPRYPHGTTGGIVKISPRTNKIVDHLIFTDRLPQDIVVADGIVWVSASSGDGSSGYLTAIDPATTTIKRSLKISGWGLGVAYGAGALWVAAGDEGHRGSVLRVDPHSLRATATVGLDDNPGAIVFGHDAVWVSVYRAGTVARIDPATNRVTARTSPLGSADAVAIGASLIWYTSFSESAVFGVDPTSLTEKARFRVVSDPSGIAEGLGALWVSESTAVRRIVR